MRVALISDLHGNAVALDAVLADIRAVGTDRIVCLGDTATLGPRPREVLDRLRQLGCACILGNHDAFMLDEQLIHSYSEAPIVVDSVDWCRAQLRDEDFEFLRGFRATDELDLGGASLLLYHGTPRSHMEDLLADTPAERVDEMLGGRRATVLAGGHTHLAMTRQHRGMLVVNPGSVGMPFREHAAGGVPVILPHAEWALVDASGGGVEVRLRRVPVDAAALRADVAGCDAPIAKALAQIYAGF
jgi:putative phosphoesterase